MYRGKPILYSLGNFVMQRSRRTVEPEAPIPPGRQAVIARATVARGAVRAIELLPIVIGLDGQPTLATGPMAVRILSGLAAMSATLGTHAEQEEWIATIALS